MGEAKHPFRAGGGGVAAGDEPEGEAAAGVPGEPAASGGEAIGGGGEVGARPPLGGAISGGEGVAADAVEVGQVFH